MKIKFNGRVYEANKEPKPIPPAHTAHEELVRACNIFLEAVGHVSGIEESRKAFIKAVAKAEEK